jgi:FixJ family two-component response regulator
MTPAAAPTVFVIDDDALVRPAIQGLLKFAGLCSETYETPQDFSRSNRPDGPRRVVRDLAERDRMQ